MGKVVKWIVLVVVLLGLGSTFIHLQNKKLKSGYCFAEKRYLKNSELEESAIKGLLSLMDENKVSIQDNDGRSITFSNIEDFKKKNFSCCGETQKFGIFKTLDGGRFIVPLNLEDTSYLSKSNIRILVSPCGRSTGFL